MKLYKEAESSLKNTFSKEACKDKENLKKAVVVFIGKKDYEMLER